MSKTSATAMPPDSKSPLISSEPLDYLLEKSPTLRRYQKAKDRSAYFFDVAEAAQAFLCAALIREKQLKHSTAHCWISCPSEKKSQRIHHQLEEIGLPCLYLPSQNNASTQSTQRDDIFNDPENSSARSACFLALQKNPTDQSTPHPLALSKSSWQDSIPSSASITEHTLCLEVAQEIELSALAEKLEQAGYEHCPLITARGQYATRGGIVDVFAYQQKHPLRIEFFGEAIDSMRFFDIHSQGSINKISSTDLLLSDQLPQDKQTLRDLPQKNDLILHLKGEEEDQDEKTSANEFPCPAAEISSAPSPPEKSIAPSYQLSCLAEPIGSFSAGDFLLEEKKYRQFNEQLDSWQREDWLSLIYLQNPSEQKRLSELTGKETFGNGKLSPLFGDLPRGFSIAEAKLAVLSSAELFGRRVARRSKFDKLSPAARRGSGAAIHFRELIEGELVVHAEHGIGKYRGLAKNIHQRSNQTDKASDEEFLLLEYDNEALLYVPLKQSHLVTRYVGSGSRAPKLSPLGGRSWDKIREKTEEGILDYAADLLEVQAAREEKSGYSHGPDHVWQSDFEATFPYTETPDQLKAILATKQDMEELRPMDRLICGDVGFGKTEVAIRAAFKCALGGRQCAILCPTTVLADQHYRNFCERMSEYPIRIALLSRFESRAKQKLSVQGLEDGSVDIVIGTHRLISDDIKFKQLGLVVIDEEQRFGVKHKELFKQKLRQVDILTLTATPIPRTLYLSMMGIRDMSVIETPPPNRIAVETQITGYDERLIKVAIERELRRGGQVFFLHNRVKTIDKLKKRLNELCPKAKIEIGHGQMEEKQLEETMRRFIAGDIDILLCTTIIESGIDIPNANTIIIDRADRFGLADLYQLRGRVGRSTLKAYALLLLPRDMVTNKTGGDARKRINAIRQYSSIGAGFHIAMRDLEIRGAGNLLGTKQSGHIAAVGFDMYCKLLRHSVERLRNDQEGILLDCKVHVDFLCQDETAWAQMDQKTHYPCFFPRSYLREASLRISCYRQLAEANNADELSALQEEWDDRFGAAPDSVKNLFLCRKIALLAAAHNISEVTIKEQQLRLKRNGEYIQIEKKFPRLTAKRGQPTLAEAAQLIEKI